MIDITDLGKGKQTIGSRAVRVWGSTYLFGTVYSTICLGPHKSLNRGLDDWSVFLNLEVQEVLLCHGRSSCSLQ
jgi:hypothetical protein